jgi:hypothetical protein
MMLTFREYLTEKVGSFIAWHGSGANFNKFLRTKAHSGEGGAAFGSGIYISKNEEVGKFYQKLSKNPNAMLYKIRVNIDTDKIMRWDLSFDKQPKPVQKVLSTIDYDSSKGTEARYYYHALRSSFSSGDKSGPIESEKATKHLEDAGLHGIYFVGDRKFKGKGRDVSQNFVIFDPNNISILQKFDNKGKEV